MSGILGTTTYTDSSQQELIIDDALIINITLASGAGNLTRGTILGQQRLALGTTTIGTNTGNGTLTAVTLGSASQFGSYTLRCTATATHGGTFSVTTPNGETLPNATVDVAYTSPRINFTLNHGATDFAVGDTFTIPVIAGSGKYTTINFSGTDGTQIARAILADDTDATSADTPSLAFVDGAYRVDHLLWPNGATTNQKAIALFQLRDCGIVTQ
ncbi:MAG: head decoration protein [Magnetococcales bacterium]|nr:head decoration protein [Magnetococcales bacterium]